MDSQRKFQSLSSPEKGSNISIPSKQKMTAFSRSRSETKERKVIKNQKENDDMSLLLDKKVVRKQQMSLYRQKNKSNETRRERERGPRVVVEAKSRQLDSSRKVLNEDTAWPCSFGAALSLSDVPPVVKKAQVKRKKENTNGERIYVVKDKRKSQTGREPDLKRKSCGSFEGKKTKRRKTTVPKADTKTAERIPRSQSPIQDREVIDKEIPSVNLEAEKVEDDLNELNNQEDVDNSTLAASEESTEDNSQLDMSDSKMNEDEQSKQDDDINDLLESEGDDADETLLDHLELEVANIVGIREAREEVDEENNTDDSHVPPTTKSTPEKESEVTEEMDSEDQEEEHVVQTEVGTSGTEISKEDKGQDGEGFNQEEIETDEENDEDSSDGDDEEEFVLFYGKDPCTNCPRCSKELGLDFSINLTTGVTTVFCDNNHCQAKIVVRNLFLDRQKTNVTYGL